MFVAICLLLMTSCERAVALLTAPANGVLVSSVNVSASDTWGAVTLQVFEGVDHVFGLPLFTYGFGSSESFTLPAFNASNKTTAGALAQLPGKLARPINGNCVLLSGYVCSAGSSLGPKSSSNSPDRCNVVWPREKYLYGTCNRP